MSVIKVTLPPGEIPAEGKQVSFKAPCPCDVTDGIQIEGVTYTVCDALGKCVTGIGGVWDVGSIVTVTLSLEQKKAYVQNNAGYALRRNENLLDNWYFADPIDQRGGLVIPPDTLTYKDAALTQSSGYTGGWRGPVTEITSTYCKWIQGATTYYAPASAAVRGYLIGTGFSIDRWSNTTPWGSIPISIVLEDGGVHLVGQTQPNYPDSYAFFRQKIKASDDLIGKQITLSVLVESVSPNNAGSYPKLDIADKSGEVQARVHITSAGLFEAHVTWSADMANVGIALPVGSSTTSTVKISAIKLELGSVQTLAHQENGNWVLNDPPPDKGVELLKCVSSTADSSDTYANGGFVNKAGDTITSNQVAVLTLKRADSFASTVAFANADGLLGHVGMSHDGLLKYFEVDPSVNHEILHKGNRDLVVPRYTATLTTSWTASGSYFYQDVSVSGILATDTPVVGVNPGSDNAANVQYSMGFSNVFRIATSANSIRVWARAKPTVAIPIQIKVVR